MGWQEDMLRCWEQQKAFEREKATTAVNDIPVDVSGLTRLVISSDYTGPSPLPLLHNVLKKATQLRDLHMHMKLLERKTTILEAAFSEAYGMPVRIEIELTTK